MSVLAILATAGCRPALGQPPAPAGKWRCWSLRESIAPAVDSNGFWFADEVFAWRIDRRTGQMRIFAPLNGRPGLGSSRGAFFAPDGQVAFSTRLGPVLLAPATAPGEPEPSIAGPVSRCRARLLPQVAGKTPFPIPFAADGSPCGMSLYRLYRYADGGWQPVGREGAKPLTPLLRPIAGLPGGRWLVYGWTENNAKWTAFRILNEHGEEVKSLPVEGAWVNAEPICPDGDGVLVVSQVLITGRSRMQVSRITADQVKELARSDGDSNVRLGIDLKSRSALRMTLLDDLDGLAPEPGADRDIFGLRYRVESTADGPLGEVVIPPDRYNASGAIRQNWPTPIRDWNGHLWIGLWRWDGWQWEQVAPPGSLQLDNGLAVLDRLRVELDGATMTWKVHPEVPSNVTGFSQRDRTGWITALEGNQPVIHQVRFDDAGAATVLRTVRDPAVNGPALSLGQPSKSSSNWHWAKQPTGKYRLVPLVADASIRNTPLFQSADGDWWWVSPFFEGGRVNEYRASRLSADGKLKLYAAPAGQKEPGRPTPYVAGTWLGPAGNVWIRTTAGVYARLDEQAGKFLEDQPWEEFSFTLGRQQLSMVPWMGTRPGSSGASFAVMKKENGQWRSLTEPGGQTVIAAHTNAVFGDRMLVRTGWGVLEYDGSADRWVVLHLGDDIVPAFDPAGRIIIASPRYVLCFEGEPFAYEADAKTEREQAERRQAGLEAKMRHLLAKMDDRQFDVREKATAEMKQLASELRAQLVKVANDPATPEELSARLRRLLAEVPARPFQPPTSLFDLITPRPRPHQGGPDAP